MMTVEMMLETIKWLHSENNGIEISDAESLVSESANYCLFSKIKDNKPRTGGIIFYFHYKLGQLRNCYHRLYYMIFSMYTRFNKF